MTLLLEEGEVQFDFSRAVSAQRFDLKGEPQPHGWRRADFVVEEAGRFLLVEVKDPYQS